MGVWSVLVRSFLTCVILALLVLSILEAPLGYEDQLVQSIRNVYSRLAEAERRGADVHDAALKLKKALELVSAAEENPEDREALLSKARELVQEVNSSIPLLIEEGERRIFWRNVMIVTAVSLVIAFSGLTYYYGPRVFWNAWLRIRSRWVIEVLERRRREGED